MFFLITEFLTAILCKVKTEETSGRSLGDTPADDKLRTDVREEEQET